MLWLLSALGIGGIGAALFLIPGAAAKAIEIAAAIWAAITKYPREAAIALLLCLSAVLWWDRGREIDRAERIEAQAKADNTLWQKAHATNLASVKLLTAALNDQSARVRALGKASERQQQAAQAALSRATARRDVSEGVAVRIERGAPVKGCQTAPEVMQAKDQL